MVRIEVEACDICRDPSLSVSTWTIRGPDGEAVTVQLCAEHAAVLEAIRAAPTASSASLGDVREAVGTTTHPAADRPSVTRTRTPRRKSGRTIKVTSMEEIAQRRQ